MKFVILIMVSILAGCTTLADLKKPEQTLEFNLEKDEISFFNRGLFNYRQARGLLKGTYQAVAEDEKGYYFLPVDGKVVNLMYTTAEQLEATNIYPESANG